ncbi:MAG TPA: hypothetical protein VKA89_06815 [Solirubrobacterales bacterium]|nr:hypothetical protein [Solirubrobacterales bacterium]
MDPPQADVSLESLLAEVGGEPVAAATGCLAVAGIVTATEERIAEIFAGAEESAAALARQAALGAPAGADARREELARVRRELLDSASALALRFEALFDLLEEAESSLASEAGPALGGEPRAVPPPAQGAFAFGGIRLTLRERRRVTFAHEPIAPGTPAAAGEGAGTPPAQGRRRRRWWRLWTREAA